MNMKTSNKHGKIIPLVICCSISAIILTTLCGIFYFRQKLLAAASSNAISYEKYDKHYALITSNKDSPFWESVYEEAKIEAKKHNAYVEYIGKSLSAAYDIQVLLRIAIDSAVDGIIIEASENLEVAELINEAVEKGIVVITVLKDSPKSERQSFIGINNYNLGQTYGQQVLNIWDEDTRRILVLMDSNKQDTNQNVIYSSIKETILQETDKSKQLDIRTVTVNNENTFSSEEVIRDIIMDTNNLPDIIICLNSIDTRCAYQAVVDHNKVGQINILGYYNSEDILKAVQKEIIHSTISIDAKQMGALCVQALDEYKTTGRVSNYLPVDTHLITLKNVNKYLKNEN
ncbi:substrate-binding domain-containing protein [Cellulosilyticum sp. I15G10I2]|uniref:substrate-binding domain-containing protein n=1 Tax=Cellulosilyticum sp. I15G10I2 TaxID=1892843 RepID=UPI00085BE942|nr:substrate-binding domain-containing protein [Cellulosilyticum sp. I15G10I2]